MANCSDDSILDGMDLATLQAQLAAMQQAYLQLLSGMKVVTAAYTQADGARSVTYTQADKEGLVQGIMLLQKQIAALNGYHCNRRPPVTPFFGH